MNEKCYCGGWLPPRGHSRRLDAKHETHANCASAYAAGLVKALVLYPIGHKLNEAFSDAVKAEIESAERGRG